MEEKDKIIQEQQKTIEEMQDDFRSIGDFADSLKAVLAPILDDCKEAPIIMLTLKKIAELADQNI